MVGCPGDLDLQRVAHRTQQHRVALGRAQVLCVVEVLAQPASQLVRQARLFHETVQLVDDTIEFALLWIAVGGRDKDSEDLWRQE